MNFLAGRPNAPVPEPNVVIRVADGFRPIALYVALDPIVRPYGVEHVIKNREIGIESLSVQNMALDQFFAEIAAASPNLHVPRRK